MKVLAILEMPCLLKLQASKRQENGSSQGKVKNG